MYPFNVSKRTLFAKTPRFSVGSTIKNMKNLEQSLALTVMAKALNQLSQQSYATINRGVSSCYEVILSEMYPSI